MHLIISSIRENRQTDYSDYLRSDDNSWLCLEFQLDIINKYVYLNHKINNLPIVRTNSENY